MLPGLEAFVHTAEEASFRRAAERLRVSPAAVSKAVARLEEELGVRLLHRSTRRVALTPEGALFLRRARGALDLLQAGVDELAQAREVPQGTLRISCSQVLGRSLLPVLGALREQHPRLEVELSVTDRFVDLIADEVDVALRIGQLEDSSLIARRLARTRWVLVASADYLRAQGRPARPEELMAHTGLKFWRTDGGLTPWTLAGRGTVPSPSQIRLDHGELLLEAARQGLGIAQVFDFMVGPELASGELVELFDELATEGPPIHALVLPGRQRAPRVRVALDLLAEAFS